METTQGNSLYSYLYLKLAKNAMFPLLSLTFFFNKIGKQENGAGSAWKWGRGRE
jgi:hypothetical protein